MEDEIVEGQEVTSGEDDLIAAIKAIKDAEENGTEDELYAEEDDEESEDEDLEEEEEDDPGYAGEDEPLDEELEDDVIDEEDDAETDETKGIKREQSREENAKFAALRRQEQIDKQVELKLAELRDASPEFELAKTMSEMYGVEPTELIEQMRESALQKEAQDRNLPVELLRERQADRVKLETVEKELNQIRFENWQSRITADSATLKADYAMLSQEDMDAAVQYILHEAKNVDMPLKQAVYALHGEKIINGLANSKTQENLANESGRKRKTPVAPKNGKAPTTSTLSADEKYVAKQMGMTESEYLKYK